jgi:AraC-like DNA-binding protein
MLSPLHNLTPYIRVAMNQQIPAGYQLHKRVIFDYYLACVAEGNVLAEVNGKPLELETGDFLFISPREEHSLRCYHNVPARLPHLHFDFFTQPDAGEVFISFKTQNELQEYESLFRKPILDEAPDLQLSTVIKPLHYEQPLEYLMKIIALQGRSSAAVLLEQRGYFFQLLGGLLHASVAQEVIRNPRHLRAMEEVMEFVRKDFAQPLTLEELAQAVHLSPSHFSHLFKQFYQLSPMHFLRNYRIEQVKRLLLTSDQSLTQIAEICGFSSIHVLSRAFKETTGQSPSDFLQGFRNDPAPPPSSCPMSGL